MGTRTDNRLTAKQVDHAKDGWHNDGRNLHLRVSNDGRSKKWVFRYVRGGQAVEIGLGSAADVSLKQAREQRDRHKASLAEGLDPREEKRKAVEDRRKAAAERAGRKTFAEAAADVIALRKATEWRTNVSDGRTSSLDEWTKQLTVDCRAIAKRAVDEIDEDDIEPIVQAYFDRARKRQDAACLAASRRYSATQRPRNGGRAITRRHGRSSNTAFRCRGKVGLAERTATRRSNGRRRLHGAAASARTLYPGDGARNGGVDRLPLRRGPWHEMG